MPSDRPNILLMLTDQHRGDCVGADPRCPTDRHGDPLVRSPTLDGIADGGALFSTAYTPAPKCIPPPKCLWTGQAAASAGATTDHNDEWDFETPLPRVLRDRGYQTQLAGPTGPGDLRGGGPRAGLRRRGRRATLASRRAAPPNKLDD